MCEATATPPGSTSCRLSRRSPTCESGWRVLVQSMMSSTTLRTCSAPLTIDEPLDTRLGLPLADIARFTALESLAVTFSRAAGKSLTSCYNMSPIILLYNSTVSTHKHLCFACSCRYSSADIDFLSPQADADIHILAATCRHLTGLELWLTDEPTRWAARVTDVGFESISKHLPQLRRFHIGNCPSITDNGIRQLAVGCPLLQDFRVPVCHNLSVRCAYEILTKCPEMRRLHCQQSWSCHWLHLLQTARLGLARLELLELYVPDDVGGTSSVMATLASCCIQMRKLHVHTGFSSRPRPDPLESCPPTPALVKLTMTGFEMRMTSFMAFLLHVPHLERLRLRSCRLVGTIQALPAIISLRFLECCVLFSKPANAFWKFGTWCPNLSSLVTNKLLCGSGRMTSSFAGCSKLVTLSVLTYWHEQLAWTCPPLGALRALFCNEMHWQDLAAIAKASPHLQEVHFRDYDAVKVEGVLDLLSSCPELNYIKIWFCSAIHSDLKVCLASELQILRGHVYEVVHLEIVDGDWGLDWDSVAIFHPYQLDTICTTYRVHRCGQR
eukprot:SM000095S24946  [mRNA]  locus=s95:25082:26796:+ [translate_table: standard]